MMSLGWGLAYVQASSLQKEIRWEEGKRHLSEGKAEEAKGAFEDLVKKYPKEPDLHLFLALSLLRLRDVRTAEARVHRAVELAPDHAEARSLLGWIYLEVRRDYPAAVEEYGRVVRLRPDSAEAHNNLGVALRKKGDLEEAIASFGRALELRPDYSQARSNRGWAYAEQKKWREARTDFERALEASPDDEGALYGLARVLKEAREYTGAQEALGKLISRSPNFIYWLEWGQLQLVRYYWLLLLVAVFFFARARYKAVRRKSYGGTDGKEA